MILAAALLALLAVLLAWPVPLAVARSAWPDRAPGTALLLWQAIALGGVLSLLGSLLVAGLAPYGDHLVAALRTLGDDVARGVLPTGTTYASMLALAAGVLLGAHLIANLVFTIVRTERQRARHRSLLLLLSAPMPETPRTRLLDAAAPIAYCLPGTARSLTVLSAGLLDLLSPQEVQGVVEHERAHLRQHGRPGRGHRLAEHLDLAGGGQHQPEQHPDRRGLAGTVRPEEAVDVALGDLEVDRVHGSQLAVALGQRARPDHRPVAHGCACRSAAAAVRVSGVTVPASRNPPPRPGSRVSSTVIGPIGARVPAAVWVVPALRSSCSRSGRATEPRRGKTIMVVGPRP